MPLEEPPSSSSIASSLQLCNVCCFPDWTSKPRDDQSRVPWIEGFEKIDESADTGCCGCMLLRRAWIYSVPRAETRAKSSMSFNSRNGNLYINCFADGVVQPVDIFTLYGDPCFMHIRQANLVPTTTHLAKTLKQIQSWLHTCTRTHSSCQTEGKSTPPRLLEISQSDSGTIKLVQFAPSAKPTKYACLSHCWGQVRSKYSLRKETLKPNMIGIPTAHLPKTFRDAIAITRRLRIKYLWIDSLCIIQDSQEDWKDHVTIMANIYEDSFITVAAGASTDDDGGCFTSPSPIYTQAEEFCLICNGVSYKFYLRQTIDHLDADWPAGEILPLMTRGWCYQERLLSSRYLCFGSQEILWECRTEVACSCTTQPTGFNPRSQLRHTDSVVPKFPNCYPTRWHFEQLQTEDFERSGRLWCAMIKEYSLRKLSYPTDKLPALAGLAQAFQNRANLGRYLSGLWSHDLDRGIAWRASPPDAPLGRPRPLPSWSWVSAADAKIEWPDLAFHNLYQLTLPKGTTRGSTEESFEGLVVTGYLQSLSLQVLPVGDLERVYTLSSRCKISTQERRPSSYHPPPPDHYEETKKELQYPESSRHRRAQTSYPEPSRLGDFWADYRFWTSEEERQIELRHIMFLTIGTDVSDTFKQPRSWLMAFDFCRVSGLVLRPAGNEAPIPGQLPRYERIGWLSYHSAEERNKWRPGGRSCTFMLV